ncbi:MAG: hypothetical protein AAGD28_05170 [Bacteroidota bacterium]
MKNLIQTHLLLILAFAMFACDSDPCQFNIDKHEILTGIDVPKTRGGACIPHEELGFKLSVWELDTLHLTENSSYGSLDGYMDRFKFTPLQGNIHEDKIKLIPEKYQESLLGDDLFYRSGERGTKRWIMIISRKNAILFGEVIETQNTVEG